MTIKAIKEEYKAYRCEKNERNSFITDDFGEEFGKVVIVLNNYLGYKDVIQVVRVADGKKLLGDDRCRPCDNRADAIDVAWEMVWDEHRLTF